MLTLVEVDAPVGTQLLGLSFTPPIASLPVSGDICTVTAFSTHVSACPSPSSITRNSLVSVPPWSPNPSIHVTLGQPWDPFLEALPSRNTSFWRFHLARRVPAWRCSRKM